MREFRSFGYPAPPRADAIWGPTKPPGVLFTIIVKLGTVGSPLSKEQTFLRLAKHRDHRKMWHFFRKKFFYTNRSFGINVKPWPVSFAERRAVLQMLEKHVGPLDSFRLNPVSEQSLGPYCPLGVLHGCDRSERS